MMKTFSALAIAASLIAGPALAQGSAPATHESTTSVPAPKAKVAVHKAHKHVAHKYVTKKHLAKKHVAKKHFAKKQVKHLKAAI